VADSKLTALTANTTPLATDLFYMVDDPGGSPLSQKIVFGDAATALFRSEISITTTATFTINRAHVISGTSSDYTVAFPAASGNAGNFIQYRVDPTATRLFTLDPNSTEKIDGDTTQIVWAKECGLAICDGSNWFHYQKYRRAMVGSAALNGNQTVAASTLTKVTVNSVLTDNTGFMVDTSNNKIVIKRPNYYRVLGAVQWSPGATLSRSADAVMDLSLTATYCSQWLPALSATATAVCTNTLLFAASDNILLAAYQENLGSTGQTVAGTNTAETCLTVAEVL
jgi:hypothetical protein